MPPLPTFYLLVYSQSNERPDVVRRCKAKTKRRAAQMFAKRLNTMAKGQLYMDTELLSAIKREDELTPQERQWIGAEDPEMLDL